jgi:hypothetical protein
LQKTRLNNVEIVHEPQIIEKHHIIEKPKIIHKETEKVIFKEQQQRGMGM